MMHVFTGKPLCNYGGNTEKKKYFHLALKFLKHLQFWQYWQQTYHSWKSVIVWLSNISSIMISHDALCRPAYKIG